MFKNFTLPGLILAGALAFLGAPSSQISATTCGGPGVVLCKENQSCLNILFYKQCTTRYDYWAPMELPGPEEPEPIGFH